MGTIKPREKVVAKAAQQTSRWLGLRPADGEDVQQDTWVTMLRLEHAGRPAEDAALLYTIARSRGVDALRKNARYVLEGQGSEERETDFFTFLGFTTHGPEEEVVFQDLVAKGIGKVLTPYERLVWYLAVIMDRPLAAIALGGDDTPVRKAYSRARQKLRVFILKEWPELA